MKNVEAYTASWIEIYPDLDFSNDTLVEAYTASWIEILLIVNAVMVYIVEAYTASWIEIRWATAPDPFTKRRSLYGFVD